MNQAIIDANFQPEQSLLLMLVAGQPYFVGITDKAVAEKIISAMPDETVLVEYITASTSGNSRHDTLAQAIKYKNSNEDISIQPAMPPKNLPSKLAEVWWNAPR